MKKFRAARPFAVLASTAMIALAASAAHAQTTTATATRDANTAEGTITGPSAPHCGQCLPSSVGLYAVSKLHLGQCICVYSFFGCASCPRFCSE